MRAILLLVVAVVLSSCGGPSSTQIRDAKSAEYKAPPKQVLDVALQVTQQTYKIGAIDPDGLRFGTASQWYSKEGGRISPNNEGGGDFVNAGGGDVQVTLIVQVHLVPNDRVVVSVTPVTFELVAESPQPRELKADDPNLPPWILGRVDSLAVEIHKHAKRYIEKP